MNQDISFCQHKKCSVHNCMRHPSNITEPQYPHSYVIGYPSDCPIKIKTCNDCVWFGECDNQGELGLICGNYKEGE